MTATAVLSRREMSAKPSHNWMDRGARVLVSLGLAGAVAWMLLNAGIVREWEAHLAAAWMNPWVDRGVTPWEDTYALWIADDHIVAFEVTAECTAVILIAPLLALGAGMMLSRRIRWVRGLLGIAAMVIVVMTVNQLRLALIGWSTQQWGIEVGYEFSHRFAGSVLGIIGFAIGLVVLILVMGVRRRRPKAN